MRAPTLGCELGPDSLRLVAIGPERSKPIVLAVELTTQGLLDARGIEAVADLIPLRALGRRLVVALEGPDLSHRLVRLPAASRRKMQQLAEIEVRVHEGREQPYSTVPIGLSAPEAEGAEVLLTSAPESEIRRARRIADQLRLDLRAVTTVPVALSHAIPQRTGVSLIVALSRRATWILALAEGRWLFGRRIEDIHRPSENIDPSLPPRLLIDRAGEGGQASPEGQFEPPDHERMFRHQDVVEEVQRTSRFLQRHHDLGIDRAWLVGSATEDQPLMDELGSSLSCPVEVWTPQPIAEAGDMRPIYGAAVASLLVRRPPGAIDLEHPHGRSIPQKLTAAAALLFAAGITGVSTVAYRESLSAVMNVVPAKHLSALKEKKEALETEGLAIQEQLASWARHDRAGRVERLRSESLPASALLVELSQRLPEAVLAENFRVERRDGSLPFELQGVIVASSSAEALEELHELRQSLEASPVWIVDRLETVPVERVVETEGERSALIRFTLRGELRT